MLMVKVHYIKLPDLAMLKLQVRFFGVTERMGKAVCFFSDVEPVFLFVWVVFFAPKKGWILNRINVKD